MRTAVIGLFTCAALSACATNTIDSDAAFQKDSWRSPTNHGQIAFGEPQHVSLTDTQRFHAWSFTLTEEADVALWSESLSNNLDTVMYLYAADEEGNKTGRYLKKNDDHDGKLASRIERSLQAGHYAVIVKAHKTQIRGSFALASQCTGDGCPQPELPLGFEQTCDLIDDGVADCVFDQSTVEECAPTDDPTALQCCNARDDNYCEVTCAAGGHFLNADLDFLYESIGDDEFAGLHDYTGFVNPVCNGMTFDDIIADARDDRSDLLDNHHEGSWNEGTKVGRNNLDHGLLYGSADFLTELDAIAGDDQLEAWYSSIEVPCPNCTTYIEKWVLFYPNTGVTIELEGEWGYDS